MKKGGGKAKGASFERKVCQQLSRLIDPAGSDTLFWRSAMSGGRATVRAKAGITDKTQAGDITCIDPRGHWLASTYSIECKHHASLDIQASLLSGKGRLAKFWAQTCRDADRAEKLPLLIARGNRCDTLMLLTDAGITEWQDNALQLGGFRVVCYLLQDCPTIMDYQTVLLRNKLCRPKPKATIPRMVPASRRSRPS